MRTIILERTHSRAPNVASNTVMIRVNMRSVEPLLVGTTRPDTWIIKNVGTSVRVLTKKLKKPTDIKLLLQVLRAVRRLFSDCELMASILKGESNGHCNTGIARVREIITMWLSFPADEHSIMKSSPCRQGCTLRTLRARPAWDRTQMLSQGTSKKPRTFYSEPIRCCITMIYWLLWTSNLCSPYGAGTVGGSTRSIVRPAKFPSCMKFFLELVIDN